MEERSHRIKLRQYTITICSGRIVVEGPLEALCQKIGERTIAAFANMDESYDLLLACVLCPDPDLQSVLHEELADNLGVPDEAG